MRTAAACLLLVMTSVNHASAEEPLLRLSFDRKGSPLEDSGSVRHPARWEGEAEWAEPGVARLPNSAESRPGSRVLVDGDDLAVDGDFTLEVRFRLTSIGSWWGSYNGTPRAVARPGDGEFYEANYYVQVQSFGDKGNLLAGGFFNGEDWEEIQMGDRRGEPGVEVGPWYTVLLQHVGEESTLTMVVLMEGEEEPLHAERNYGVSRPHPSAQPLVIGHGGKDSKDSWLDGDVDYVTFWKDTPKLPVLDELDFHRAPPPIALKGVAYEGGVHLTWNAGSDETTVLYRQLDEDTVSIGAATVLDTCELPAYVDAVPRGPDVAAYAVTVHGARGVRTSGVAVVPLSEPATPRVEATFPSSVYLSWDPRVGGFARPCHAVYVSQGETRRLAVGPDTSFTVRGLSSAIPCTLTLAVVTPGGSEGPRSTPVVAEVPPVTGAVGSCAVIEVLVAIPTDTPGGQISPEEVEQIRAGMELTRQFYWRNSGCRLDIPLDFLPISRALAGDEFGNDGLLWPQFLEPVLRTERVDPEPYGMFFGTYPPMEGGGNYGGMTAFGGRGYSFATYPLRTSVVYPGDDPAVNYSATWLLCHELQHSVDLVGYEKSGRSEMWHGDKPLDFALREGQQFSYQAGIFRDFDGYRDIREPWGHLIETVDSDADGMPDMDCRFPMDELRFGSDPRSADSDGDGLDDLGEFMAGIYGGSDPAKPDTDGDAVPDGDDPLPLYAFAPEVPYHEVVVDGAIDAGLPPRSVDLFWAIDSTFACSTYLAWHKPGFVIGVRSSRPTTTVIELDAADDGWWHGRDNYRLVYRPDDDSLAVAVMDATPETRRYNLESGGYEVEMWDTNSRYTGWRGRLAEPATIRWAGERTGESFTLEVEIPSSDSTALILAPDRTMNVRIYFPDVPASLFENYQLIPVTLAAKDP